MNTPNFYLADLPKDAELTPKIISEACETLQRNRAQYLKDKSLNQMILLLSQLGEEWSNPDFDFRKRARMEGPEKTGFSKEVIDAGLADFFSKLTSRNIKSWLRIEFGSIEKLQQFSPTQEEEHQSGTSRIICPEMIYHVAGGVLPNPVLMNLVTGLLLRSAQFVKAASGASYLPLLFLHSLYLHDSKVAACMEIAEWEGGRTELESVLYKECDLITATGSNETLGKIRAQVPHGKRYLEYGHAVSFSFVAREQLDPNKIAKTVELAARDVVAWDQSGCLSPHAIYVEAGGAISAAEFAERFSDSLTRLESIMPRGSITTDEAATIQFRRSFYEVRAKATETIKLWKSTGSTAWTVVYDEDPLFQLSCLNRFIFIKGAENIAQIIQACHCLNGQISTVGISAPESRYTELGREFSKWGVSRICPVGKMQSPPLHWRHDGRPSIGDWVKWCDMEME
ncbi:MAG: Acyl-CoA reductase [Verrucomicrobiales bacterium]|nr:Acyl-CoA reductase [Verrucomicrobiales bacterium]